MQGRHEAQDKDSNEQMRAKAKKEGQGPQAKKDRGRKANKSMQWTKQKQERRQIKKTQDELQWIVAQRLLKQNTIYRRDPVLHVYLNKSLFYVINVRDPVLHHVRKQTEKTKQENTG